MKISKLHTAIAIASWLVLAQTNPAWAAAQTAAFDHFVNGGIGLEARQEMQSQRHLYNVHLVFAKAGSGEFVSGVALELKRIGHPGQDAHFDNCGPLFYIRLQPGRYRLQAEFEGKTQQATIQVGAGTATHYLYWH